MANFKKINEFESSVIKELKLEVDQPGWTALTIPHDKFFILLDRFENGVIDDEPNNLCLNMCVYIEEADEPQFEETLVIDITNFKNSIKIINKTIKELIEQTK